MAKLQRAYRSESDRERMKRLADDLVSGRLKDGGEFNHIGEFGLTPKVIVDAYRQTGEYYDLDYPGGIEQFVTDYELGKFDG